MRLKKGQEINVMNVRFPGGIKGNEIAISVQTDRGAGAFVTLTKPELELLMVMLTEAHKGMH